MTMQTLPIALFPAAFLAWAMFQGLKGIAECWRAGAGRRRHRPITPRRSTVDRLPGDHGLSLR